MSLGQRTNNIFRMTLNVVHSYGSLQLMAILFQYQASVQIKVTGEWYIRQKAVSTYFAS